MKSTSLEVYSKRQDKTNRSTKEKLAQLMISVMTSCDIESNNSKKLDNVAMFENRCPLEKNLE